MILVVPLPHGLPHAGLFPRNARRGIESSTRLGRHRWVVERAFAWLNRYRRLAIRYERCADFHLAFLTLAEAKLVLEHWRDCNAERAHISLDSITPSAFLPAASPLNLKPWMLALRSHWCA